MRITQSMILRNTLQRVNQNKINLNDLNKAISTGKKVIDASDDPVNFTRASRFKETIKQNEQYLRNITNTVGWVETSSTILDHIVSLMKEGKEIATKGADAATFAPARMALAQTIDSKIEELIDLLNSEHAGKNIFAGTETKIVTPFSIAGDIVTYTGNTEDITRKVSENLSVSINTTGQELLDTGMFTALIDLRNALNADDITIINNSIDVIATVAENVIGISTTNGLVMNNLILSEERLEDSIYELKTFVSRDENADMAEAIVKYESEELAYRAAMQSASRILSLNIMDFIR